MMAEGPILGQALDPWARRAILALTLVLSCVLGLITPYLLAIIGIVLWVASAFRRQLVATYADPAARLFLVAFAMLAVCFSLTAEGPQDVLFSFNFVMLPLFAPIRSILSRGAGPHNAKRFADLALAGAATAFLAAAIGRFGFGFERGESPVFGAILLGNTAILLGFLGLTGVIAGRSRRWLYLAGPILGIATTLVTESRGPLIAVVPLSLLAAIYLGRALRLRPLWWGAGGAGVVLLVVAAALLSPARIAELGTIAGNLLAGAPIADETTRIRLALYAAGYQAFLQSPWIGHGWAELMSSIVPFLSADYAQHAGLPQLHNDVVNFAVAGGIVGVAVYLLLIATPVVSALNSGHDGQYAVRLLGTLVLGTAYVFDGLTDLMIGFEFHTALYVCLAAILIGYCRDAPMHAAPKPA